MKAVLARDAPGVPVLDLFADAPPGDALSGAYLLAAYAAWWPAGTVFLCVVDPGVGSDRAPVILHTGQHWFVGPDNGLFELVHRRATHCQTWHITWSPPALSASFHGRDLFAPVAATLARGDPPPGEPQPPTRRPDWPDDLPRVIYIDHYGNAITGLRASTLPAAAQLRYAGRVLSRARTFSDVPAGHAFWYENSNGLAEIAVNRARADIHLGIVIGAQVAVIEPS
jgi:S-adenosylmethionine hydrolase